MTNQVIPEAAVEAAALATYGSESAYDTWTDEEPKIKAYYREAARLALEAAAPHIQRTITTAEELDALEVTAVIRGKWLAEKWADPEGDMWHVAGKGMNWDTEQLVQRGGLPATVLLEVRK